MATILAAVSEDGTIRRIRELKPQRANSRRGRLAAKTIKGHTAAAEKGARRKMSPWQYRGQASGQGVLAEPGMQFTADPQAGPNVYRPGFNTEAETGYVRPEWGFATLPKVEAGEIHPRPEQNGHTTGFHLVMPDISPEKMAADIAADLEIHRAECARRKAASKRSGR